jgi:hypothetical protein
MEHKFIGVCSESDIMNKDVVLKLIKYLDGDGEGVRREILRYILDNKSFTVLDVY